MNSELMYHLVRDDSVRDKGPILEYYSECNKSLYRTISRKKRRIVSKNDATKICEDCKSVYMLKQHCEPFVYSSAYQKYFLENYNYFIIAEVIDVDY